MSTLLKHKSMVSEPEFFEYLNNVCQNEHIKNMILDFYNMLKANDDKLGKRLTIKSFGRTPENYPSFPLYTDQAKSFLSAEHQAKDDALIAEFSDILQKSQDITDEKLREEAIDKAFNAYISQQDEIFNQYTNAIGESDLFRFQFVNFVNEVTAEENSQASIRGFFSPLNKLIKLYNISDDLLADKSTKLYFKLQNTINHELTHLLSMKTVNFGFYPHFISPGMLIAQQGTRCMYNPQIANLITNNSKLFFANMAAEDILNEAATDFYSVYAAKRLATYDFQSTYYENIPTLVFGAVSENQKHDDFTSYGELGHIFAIIFENNNGFSKCFFNNDMPVWGQYNIINNFLESAQISPELERQIESTLSQTFNIEKNQCQKFLQFDKFKLLVGTCFNKPRAEKPTSFDENMMLAQSMILDIMHSRIRDALSCNAYNSAEPEFNEENLKAYLNNLKTQAQHIDKWIIKPNQKILNGDGQFSWVRDIYCNAKLAEIAPQNPAVQVWAKYLHSLCTSMQKLAPEILEKSPLLKSEYEYLKKTKNNKLTSEK